MFNQTFFRFFLGFVVIIGAAFGVLMWAGTQVEPEQNVAQPQ